MLLLSLQQRAPRSGSTVFTGIPRNVLLYGIHQAVEAPEIEPEATFGSGHKGAIRGGKYGLRIPPLGPIIAEGWEGAVVSVIATVCVISTLGLALAWRKVAEAGRLAGPHPRHRI